MPRGTVSDYDFIHWIKWWWDASRDPFPWSCLSEEDFLCQNVVGDIYDGIIKVDDCKTVDNFVELSDKLGSTASSS